MSLFQGTAWNESGYVFQNEYGLQGSSDRLISFWNISAIHLRKVGVLQLLRFDEYKNAEHAK